MVFEHDEDDITEFEDWLVEHFLAVNWVPDADILEHGKKVVQEEGSPSPRKRRNGTGQSGTSRDELRAGTRGLAC